MIIAIDIGNTNTMIGCCESGNILFRETVSTSKTAAPIEYASIIRTAFELNGHSPSDIEGGIISSVVPSLTASVSGAVKRLSGITPLIVGPGIKTGLSIMIDDPAQLGGGMVANAAAGVRYYPLPLIIVDMGTATTLSVIDKNGRYCGGMIAPGVEASLESLVKKTAQLPMVAAEPPKRIIGKNTAECIKSGLMYGSAGMTDSLIDRIFEETGEEHTIIATGNSAAAVIPLCRHEIAIDNDLPLKGLAAIYERNR